MSAWFKKNLGDAMLSGESLDKIEALFLSVYGKSENPKDAAVFIRHESEGHLHCDVHVYFSPEAAIVAREVDADPCVRPSLDGLSLLIGPENSLWALFMDAMDDS